MPARLEYAVVGSGRWAGVMHRILAEGAKVTLVAEVRHRDDENDGDYQARIGAVLLKTGARAAWLCLPPSSNIPLILAAAIDNGMHVVVEKPWVWSRPESRALTAQAEARGVVLGVHYEYCLLDAVEFWRARYKGRADLNFSGRFTTSQLDRLGISAMANLGSHLFAIRAYAVPESAVLSVDCGYEQPDERAVFLTEGDRVVDRIDFTANREPIIQRFIAQFEKATEGVNLPFSLDFAARVWEEIQTFQKAR